MADDVAPRTGARSRTLATIFRVVVTGGCVVLIPWIVLLAFTLPAHVVIHHWDIVWIGFDVLVVLALGMTAAGAWTRRQFTILASAAAGTLMICDAWFDVAMSWGTAEQLSAIVLAFIGEIPMAVFLYWAAVRMLRTTLGEFWERLGNAGPLPSLLRAPLVLSTAAATPRP